MATRIQPINDYGEDAAVLSSQIDQRPETVNAAVPRLPGIATQLIGERIRAMYGSMTQEPVPDGLLELVRKLEDKERLR